MLHIYSVSDMALMPVRRDQSSFHGASAKRGCVFGEFCFMADFQEIQEKLRGSWADLKPVWSASADGILLEFSDRFGNEGSLLVPFADLDNVVNMTSPFYIYLQMATL